MTANDTKNQNEQDNLPTLQSEKSSLKPKQKRHRKKKSKPSFSEKYQTSRQRAETAKKRRHFTLTSDESFNELLRLSGENFYNVIVKDNVAGAEWETIIGHPTQPRELLELYRDKNVIVGLRDGYMTQLLKADIDRGSAYHPFNNELELRRLLGVLEDIGLVRVSVVQSSDSQGIHLFICLPEPVVSWYAANSLVYYLTQAGFTIATGQLEIFPNRKQYSKEKIINFNGIRLPLQPDSGSYVLDPFDFFPIHNDLKSFIDTLKHQAQYQDMVQFKKCMENAYKAFQETQQYRRSSKSKGAAAFRKSLETTVHQGWTGKGQTNDLIPEAVKLALVFWKLEGEELIKRVTDFMRTLPGYEEYCGHKHNLEQRVKDWYKCLDSKQDYYAYTGEYRPRNPVESYGESVQATLEAIKQREDGRRNNEANKARHQEARDKLARVAWFVRKQLRQADSIPMTMRGWLKLMIDAAKELFGKGFSMEFLYQHGKGLIAKLKGFAARLADKPSKEPISYIGALATEAVETASQEALRTNLVEQTTATTVEVQAIQSVTTNFPIYEGGGDSFPLGVVLKFIGSLTGGLVELLRPASSITVCAYRTLKPGTLVELTGEIHSMQLSHDLVYVKPLDQPWLGGIAVSIKFLIPFTQESFEALDTG